MFKEIAEKIWQVTGSKDGPNLVICGGVHGDELIGIEVVEKLKEMFEKEELKLEKGNLTLILANVEAIKSHQRATAPEIDLNDLFYPEHLSGRPLKYYESRRARVLAPFLLKADIFIDIHATDSGSEPFLPCPFTPKHEKIYRWFDTDIVLTDPKHLLFGRKFLSADELVDRNGGIGICFEAGWYRYTRRVPIILESVLNILADQGMIKPAAPLVPPDKKFRVYELVGQVLLTSAGFRYAEAFAKARSFAPIKKGQAVGYAGARPVVAPADGVIVFPKTEERWADAEKDILYFARPVE